MTTQSVTLSELIKFEPKNDEEKQIYNINHYIINYIKTKLNEGMYYLGGQIKMSYESVINLELFDKIREIERENEMKYGGPCNSWEAQSINQHNQILLETETILKKYFQIIALREKVKQ